MIAASGGERLYGALQEARAVLFPEQPPPALLADPWADLHRHDRLPFAAAAVAVLGAAEPETAGRLAHGAFARACGSQADFAELPPRARTAWDRAAAAVRAGDRR